MYLLALTTPIHEITSTLSRLHVPGILIELMYLIYRFIFLLSETAHQMHMAAQSRLGYWGWRQSMQTFGKSMANLLVTALRQAGNTYDAMVARCYDGRLAFWTEAKPVTPVQVASRGGDIWRAWRLCGCWKGSFYETRTPAGTAQSALFLRWEGPNTGHRPFPPPPRGEGGGTGRKWRGEVHLLSASMGFSRHRGGNSVPVPPSPRRTAMPCGKTWGLCFRTRISRSSPPP